MPIYEYECRECGESFEMLVPMSAKEPPDCPKCGGRDVKKKISRTASGKSECGSCSSTGCSSSGFS